MKVNNLSQSTEEEWRAIEGFENYYEISNKGRVRSLDRVIKEKGSEKTQRKRGVYLQSSPIKAGGYHCVALYKGAIGKSIRIHQVVYETFVGPIPQGMVIMHLNDQPADNRLENLKLGTRFENSRDMVAKNRQRQGTDHHSRKISYETALSVKALFASGTPVKEIYKILGLTRSNTEAIAKNVNWRCIPEFMYK